MKDCPVEKMIGDLTRGLEPVSRLAHPYVRIVPFFAGSLLYMALVVYLVGMRPDIAVKIHDTSFLFEMLAAAIIFFSAGIAASWLCVPDVCGKKWMVSIPIAAALVMIAWSAIRALAEGLALPEWHWDHCFRDAFLMGAVPMAALVFITSKGTTCCNCSMGLMNVLSITALGYMGLRLTCMLDTVGHSLIYHVLPFIFLGTILGALARRIYRW